MKSFKGYELKMSHTLHNVIQSANIICSIDMAQLQDYKRKAGDRMFSVWFPQAYFMCVHIILLLRIYIDIFTLNAVYPQCLLLAYGDCNMELGVFVVLTRTKCWTIELPVVCATYHHYNRYVPGCLYSAYALSHLTWVHYAESSTSIFLQQHVGRKL